ncbi:hypothetical protein FNV43_RR01934 [Rhamnella rubrinervis]|uniref:Uncharacterized protein n=1 Tax=Rhamnella rubrinervis TaxID=2594499 RepID=A0A8K0HQJ0_9ROSA|nr:hypothetical protein FNV43_RR01934 [Rhamnella rubrinervis]
MAALSNTETTPKKGVNALQHPALTKTGNLIRLLPTGTVFLFQFLNPALTNTGSCSTLNKYLDAIFIGFCGLTCLLSSFTDSYTKDGKTYYGIVTTKGLWPSPSTAESADLSHYKLKFDDFVQASFALIVFAALALMDSNTVRCFYPDFETSKLKQVVLQALPPVLGTISTYVFLLFPNKRHGIGYPPSQTSPPQNTTTPQNSNINQAEKSI